MDQQQMLQRMDQIRYVAGHYYILQGLMKMPWGLAVLVSTAVRVGWLPTPDWAENYIDVSNAGVLISALLLSVITLYYRRTFGHIVPRYPHPWRLLALLLGVFGVLVVAILVDQRLHPPVILSCLVMAAVLFGYFWPHRRFAWYYIGLAVIIGAAGLLPLTGLITADQYLPLGALAWGAILFVGGLFDHLLLLRTMGARPQEEQNAAL